MSDKKKNSKKLNHATGIKIPSIVASIAIVVFAIIFVANRHVDKNETLPYSTVECQRLKYWSFLLQDGSPAPYPLAHDVVFKKMNFEFVNGSKGDDWDILWAYEHPWLQLKNQKLLPHQKVNHFPGSDDLIYKSDMNYLNNGEFYMLPAFDLPKDKIKFEKYLKENPDKKIIEKSIFSRGIEIVDSKNLKPKEDHFYQEFLSDPFLIDGRAFDLGVFVLITSFDPIRAYRSTDDIILRFCTEDYHPFDAKNRNKYVVKTGNIPGHRMPSFAKLRGNFKYSLKNIFEKIIAKQGFDVEKFWNRIDEAIPKIIAKAEGAILRRLKDENHSMHHFFDFVRFDVLLDAKLNPYIIEVNMSPNTVHDQSIFNVVKMIGGSSYHEFYSRLDETDLIVSNYKNLATSLDFCLQPECENCNGTLCKICRPCMTPEVRYQLSEAFREHQNSANFKRVFPTKNHFDDDKLIAKMTENNQIQMRWFKGKCEEDERWC